MSLKLLIESVSRPDLEQHGGKVEFNTFEELEQSFAKEEVHPGDLKSAVEKYLNQLLEPVRKKFESPELKKLTQQAYPPPAKVKPGQKGPPGAAAADEVVPSRYSRPWIYFVLVKVPCHPT